MMDDRIRFAPDIVESLGSNTRERLAQYFLGRSVRSAEMGSYKNARHFGRAAAHHALEWSYPWDDEYLNANKDRHYKRGLSLRLVQMSPAVRRHYNETKSDNQPPGGCECGMA